MPNGTEMTMDLVELPAMQFTGIERNYQELQQEGNGFCNLWTQRFPEKRSLIQPISIEGRAYGVYRINKQTRKLNEPTSFCAALKTDSAGKVPEGCARYALPPGKYALFKQAPGYLCELAELITTKIAEAGLAVVEDATCFETDAPPKSGQGPSVNVWVPVVSK
jgi:predicted transcriptional regulator YdeE